MASYADLRERFEYIPNSALANFTLSKENNRYNTGSFDEGLARPMGGPQGLVPTQQDPVMAEAARLGISPEQAAMLLQQPQQGLV